MHDHSAMPYVSFFETGWLSDLFAVEPAPIVAGFHAPDDHDETSHWPFTHTDGGEGHA